MKLFFMIFIILGSLAIFTKVKRMVDFSQPEGLG